MSLDLSVISRALTSLYKPTSSWLGRKIIGEEIIERRKLDETALQPVLQRAAESVSEAIEPLGKAEIDQICLFLTSSEVEGIVRQIYAASILEIREQNLELIEQEFLQGFSLYTNIPENELRDSVKPIFEALIGGCEAALTVAIGQGRLSAHEAKSAFRHRILYDEIATLKKNLELLTAPQKPNVQEILKFEATYRQQVANRHNKITPPYLDSVKKLPIDALYVTPNFLVANTKEQESLSLNISEFRQIIYRTVLLGNPGVGKSTFTKKLCYDLASRYSERLLAGRKVTPILVILHDYGAKKKEFGYSILQFIETTATSDYQVEFPEGAFQYLLLNNRVVVIFDGLDELTNTKDRQDISSDVESFCNLYPSVPVLVTSRVVGYKEAPLDEDKFEIFRLKDFNDKQVEEYVEKWFRADIDLNDQEKQQKTRAFLDESRSVPDLRSNPLMLGLMCNIYRGEGYIPKNLPDVYSKCADMMFERWDKSRNIHLPAPIKNIESKIRPAMMYLANWIYSNKKLQGGVQEQKLIHKATEYLLQRRFEDRDDAEQAASNFISFCRGRAWVFTDIGTTKDGDALYQFTHRTFLEYFTAAYLDRTNRTPEELLEILLPRIAKQEWDVVTQLAFQIQNKGSEEAGDKLLTAVLEKVINIEQVEDWNFLSFAVRCLDFIIPSPKVIRNITTVCIENCLYWSIKEKEEENSNKYGEISLFEQEIKPGKILIKLLNSAEENREIIGNTVKSFIINKIQHSSESEAIAALEIGLNLDSLFTASHRGRQEIEASKTWERISNDIYKVCNQQLNAMRQNSFLLSLQEFKLGQVSTDEFIKWNDVNSLFTFYYSPVLCLFIVDIATFYFDVVFELFSSKDINLVKYKTERLKNLKELGCVLLFHPQPWLRSPLLEMQKMHLQDLITIHILDSTENENLQKQFEMDSDTMFGFICLLAPMWEASGLSEDNEELIEDFNIHQINPCVKFIFQVVIAHSKQTNRDELKTQLKHFNFTTEQENFIWQWVTGEINLVE